MGGRKLLLSLFLGIFLIGIVSAATYCCEQTTSGAYCQNVNSESQCATGTSSITGQSLRDIAASCDQTSFCKPGTCVIQQQGICMSNTPEIVCTGDYGQWYDQPKSDVPQCKLGCCLIGSQSAFVTQTACKVMSVTYSLNTTFQPNINDELTCLSTANPGTDGACVYTQNYVTTCQRTTREQCQSMQKSSSFSNVEFHPGYLCSAEELGTNCAATANTRCSNGDVYFVDSCSNLANIYDASKIITPGATGTNSQDTSSPLYYWTKIQNPTCGDGTNKNSATCGKCNYIQGSMCEQKKATDKVTGGTLTGNYFCKSLDCESYTGSYPSSITGSPYPRHGESWCVTDSQTNSGTSVGANDYKMLCMDGEVTSYMCDATRQKVCVQGIVDENGNGVIDSNENFLYGNCKALAYSDCISQTTQKDCEDYNVRDCKWVPYPAGWTPKQQGDFKDYSSSLSDTAPIFQDSNGNNKGGACVPAVSPGSNINPSDNVIAPCSAANSVCYIVRETSPILGTESIAINKECTDSSWLNGMMGICNSLGDCGTKTNYIGNSGDTSNSLSSALNVQKDVGSG